MLSPPIINYNTKFSSLGMKKTSCEQTEDGEKGISGQTKKKKWGEMHLSVFFCRPSGLQPCFSAYRWFSISSHAFLGGTCGFHSLPLPPLSASFTQSQVLQPKELTSSKEFPS